MEWTLEFENLMGGILKQARIEEKKYLKSENRAERWDKITKLIAAVIAISISSEVLVGLPPQVATPLTALGGFLIAGLLAFSRIFSFSTIRRESLVNRTGCLILINKVVLQLTLRKTHRQDVHSFTSNVMQEASQLGLLVPTVDHIDGN